MSFTYPSTAEKLKGKESVIFYIEFIFIASNAIRLFLKPLSSLPSPLNPGIKYSRAFGVHLHFHWKGGGEVCTFFILSFLKPQANATSSLKKRELFSILLLLLWIGTFRHLKGHIYVQHKDWFLLSMIFSCPKKM